MLPTVTPEVFKSFKPCWLETEEGRRKFRVIGAMRPEWTALDVLALENVSTSDRLWAVLREEFIPAAILHGFACWCADEAMKLVERPDPRSIAAVVAKRAWLRGEIDRQQLAAAADAARDAAWAAAWAAWDAAGDAAGDAGDAAGDAARSNQIAYLCELLREA